MLESAWIFVGRIAFLWTVLTVLGATYLDSADDGLTITGGVIGFVLWGVWTFGALNIEVIQGTNTIAFQHPELAVLGVAMALIPGYIALTGPIELVSRYRDASLDDV